MRQDHSVLVFGTRIRFGTAGKEPDRAPTVTRMDGIVEVDLVRSGVAYTVAVECERPTEDQRCAADAYVIGLVAQLAGGKP
jgi:predicted TIM-barrel enzyme